MRKLFALCGAACLVACGTLLTIDPDETTTPTPAVDADQPVDAGGDRSAIDAAVGETGCAVVLAESFDGPGASIDPSKWMVVNSCLGAQSMVVHDAGKVETFSCPNAVVWGENWIHSKSVAIATGQRTEVSFSFAFDNEGDGNHVFATIANVFGDFRGLSFSRDGGALVIAAVDNTATTKPPTSIAATWPLNGSTSWHTIRLSITVPSSAKIEADLDGADKRTIMLSDAGAPTPLSFRFGLDHLNGMATTTIDDIRVESCPQ